METLISNDETLTLPHTLKGIIDLHPELLPIIKTDALPRAGISLSKSEDLLICYPDVLNVLKMSMQQLPAQSHMILLRYEPTAYIVYSFYNRRLQAMVPILTHTHTAIDQMINSTWSDATIILMRSKLNILKDVFRCNELYMISNYERFSPIDYIHLAAHLFSIELFRKDLSHLL